MLGRQSLLWKLAVLLVTFSLLVISLTDAWARWLDNELSMLGDHAQSVLNAYAEEADQVFHQGPQAVEQFTVWVRHRERRWAVVIDKQLQPMGTAKLTSEQHSRLTAMRRLDWPMRFHRHRVKPHVIAVPLQHNEGFFVIELPDRLWPGDFHIFHVMLPFIEYLLPAVFALLFGIGLYRVLIAPMVSLRNQAIALRADRLDNTLSSDLVKRPDELGELARAMNHMADRLKTSIKTQRDLLHDVSHELRTPLARLQAAVESNLIAEEFTQRVEREVLGMRSLIDDTLELAWLDTERPHPELLPIEVVPMWEMLCEDACFENAWPRERLQCLLPEDCFVLGELNSLARAFENVLRNAIRHSPSNGVVTLGGEHHTGSWLLWIEDQGPGVGELELEKIFRPFTRLSLARPNRDGYGLGLSIAERMIHLQNGSIWAENCHPGLRICFKLHTV